MTKSPRLFARTWRAGALLLILIIIYFLVYFLSVKYGDQLKTLGGEIDLLKHVFLTLIVVMGVHLLERAWLWKDIAEWNKNSLQQVLQESERLVKSAAECGLKRIYSNRKEVKADVLDAITGAKSRVWLLGVGLSAKINFEDDLLPLLKTKLKGQRRNKVDVRILLLDALSRTAVFRTFIESPAEEVTSIMDTDRSNDGLPASEVYFRQRLYRDFEPIVSALKQLQEFRASVRFYTHTPSCWLVITDDTAYFQPYTFGGSDKPSEDDFTIGHLLPVFRYDEEEQSSPFQILENHFERLWSTSNMDLFHIDARLDDRRRVVHKIFRSHKDWFNHLYGVLHHPSKPTMSDRRIFPRRPCESKISISFTCLEQAEGRNSVPAEIVNFSRGGLCLKVKKSDLYLRVGETLKVTVDGELDSIAAKHFEKELLYPTRGVFRIVHLRGNTGDWTLGVSAG